MTSGVMVTRTAAQRGNARERRRLWFSIKVRMRANSETGELTRFDAAVDGGHVG